MEALIRWFVDRPLVINMIMALVFLLAWKALLLWWWLTTDGTLLWLVVVPALARASAVALLIGVPAARGSAVFHHACTIHSADANDWLYCQHSQTRGDRYGADGRSGDSVYR